MNTPREERRLTPADCLLPKADVKARLGIGEKALQRLIATGRLPVVKFGKTSPLKFKELSVRQLIEASTVTGPAPGEAGEEAAS